PPQRPCARTSMAPRLLHPEQWSWIDAGCAPGRKNAGQCRDQKQKRRHDDESQCVMSADAIKESRTAPDLPWSATFCLKLLSFDGLARAWKSMLSEMRRQAERCLTQT